MNWGYRIVLAYLAFVIILTVLAFKSFRSEVNLVAEDYYRQEIAYQEQIDKIENELALNESVAITWPGTHIMEITFPDGFAEARGNVHLYRPSDAGMDRFWPIKLDAKNRQRIHVADLAPGRWILKLDWEVRDKGYYKQQRIFIP